MTTTTTLDAPYCHICDRDVAAMPAEVALLVKDVCVTCWIDSVANEIHTPEQVPEIIRPLLPRRGS